MFPQNLAHNVRIKLKCVVIVINWVLIGLYLKKLLED